MMEVNNETFTYPATASMFLIYIIFSSAFFFINFIVLWTRGNFSVWPIYFFIPCSLLWYFTLKKQFLRFFYVIRKEIHQIINNI